MCCYVELTTELAVQFYVASYYSSRSLSLSLILIRLLFTKQPHFFNSDLKYSLLSPPVFHPVLGRHNAYRQLK